MPAPGAPPAHASGCDERPGSVQSSSIGVRCSLQQSSASGLRALWVTTLSNGRDGTKSSRKSRSGALLDRRPSSSLEDVLCKTTTTANVNSLMRVVEALSDQSTANPSYATERPQRQCRAGDAPLSGRHFAARGSRRAGARAPKYQFRIGRSRHSWH
eukprot:3499064-Pleurochrysis_carterae.AAC.3